MSKHIQKGKVCWNCKHSIFYKRTGDNYGRGRGWCVQGLDMDTNWRPPDLFRQTLPTMKSFPDTFEEFCEQLAGAYYGKRYALDLSLGTNLHGDWKIAEESYKRMKKLFTHWPEIDEVSWQDVCELHSER